MMDEEPVIGRFASLQIPVYRTLITGGLFTFLAMQMSTIARGWLAYELTGTNTALGGVLIGFGLASVIAIPTGGVLADRFPKRKVLLVAGTIQTATSTTLAIVIATDRIEYWMLIVASVMQGAAISLLGPSRLAFIAEVVDRERLTNAVFLSQSTLQFTRVLGPAIAGTLIGVRYFGISGVYFLAAGISAVSLVLTLTLPEGRPSTTSVRTPWEDVVDGVRYVRSRPRLAHLLVLSFAVVLVAFPHIAFLPVVSAELFDAGSAGFGALTTAAAIGALAASLGFASIGPSRLWKVQSIAGVLFGASLIVFAGAPQLWVAMIVMVGVGASSAAFQALNNSLALTIADIEYHGRVQSLLMLSFSGFALAALPLGILADAVGIRWVMAGMGAATLLIMAVSLSMRQGLDVKVEPGF